MASFSRQCGSLPITTQIVPCRVQFSRSASSRTERVPGGHFRRQAAEVESTSVVALNGGHGVEFPTIEQCVGGTPLVRLQRMPGNTTNIILCKLEGDNPAGSVKDRPALSMIQEAERKGLIKPGDTLIEATSGNTGIALAMAAAIKGYKMILIMPSNMSEERRAAMAAYGAEFVSVPDGAMEIARDMAKEMEREGRGIVLDQFGNLDNPLAHFNGTGPELWEQTKGKITHFVSSMGTTGTIMGTSRFLKSKNPDVQIVGLQPAEGAQIAGIRRWPKEYLPSIFEESRVDRVMDVTAREAEETTRALGRMEGIFCGVSSGGAVSAGLRLSAEVENSVIVCIICDRGDRYLSTGMYGSEAMKGDPAPCPMDEYASAVARLPAYPSPRYILFSADIDENTGEPWCGDCSRVAPLARQAVEEAGGTLLEVRVGPKARWKDPEHPFRKKADLELTCIPTIFKWEEEGPWARLDTALEAAKDPKDSAKLLQEFLAVTKE